VSRAAVIVAVLVVGAGVAVTFLAYRTPTTGDGQEALVIPFIIFWTVLAVGLVWLLDWVIRAIRREYRR
jgi:hypothetical protein